FESAYNLYRKKASQIKSVDKNIIAGIKDYLNVTSSTIGVRQQNKIPRELALYLASCRSSHKNLTLYF
ncbi:hypothetical protein OAK51_06570, partial [Alphaproteobacteria bacterium]|nr:hypothetical protein [Alphaproteobacteria bacterium]